MLSFTAPQPFTGNLFSHIMRIGELEFVLDRDFRFVPCNGKWCHLLSPRKKFSPQNVKIPPKPKVEAFASTLPLPGRPWQSVRPSVDLCVGDMCW